MNMMLLYRVLAWASVAVALVGFGYVRGLVADQAADEARMAVLTRSRQVTKSKAR